MPPLTLEQVLARSMRLPRRHARQLDAHSVNSVAPVAPLLSVAKTTQGENGVAKLFSLIEKEEETIAASRPSIQKSGNLIRNSQDLLAYLHTTKRMRAWEDALQSFAEATETLLIKQSEDSSGIFVALREKTECASGGDGVTANVAHLAVLLDTCGAAKQWYLVERLGELFRGLSPGTLIHTVKLLTKTKEADVAEGELHGWRRALHFLRMHIPLEEQPVEAYNVCLSACEQTVDWEGAFAILQSMGPNVVQKVAVSKEGVLACPNNVQEEDEIVAPKPPQPNVVTYATLISVLEQSGKDALAAEVLQRLPPLEKEEITAAYAALIHVWSEQKCRSGRRRF